jgi:hypothetical protein
MVGSSEHGNEPSSSIKGSRPVYVVLEFLHVFE